MKKNMKAFVYPMAIALIAVGLISCKPKINPSSQNSSEPKSDVSSNSGESSASISESSSPISSSPSSSLLVQDVIELKVVSDNVKIKNTKINTFDYTSLFSLKVNGEFVTIDEDMIDRSQVINKEGTYEVICTYQSYKVVAHVTVEDEVLSEITSTVESITLKLKEVEDYDFTSCFRVTYNMRPVSVTSSMITSNVEAKEGTYTVTCSYKGASKSITVYVEENYKIEIIEAYHNLEIPLSKMDSLDYKNLFYLFVDGVNKEITDDMIDHSSVTNVEVNNTYSITLSYQIEDNAKSKTISFKVVNDDEIVINSRNEIVYSNSLTLDATSLFTIYEGGKEIEVTKDMIDGEIIYDQIGTYTLTLNYKGQEKTCTVEVKKGVNIQYHSSSRIVIKHGTNQSTYNFAGDFVVSVDGVIFNLNNSYIDTSKVDFSKEGEYQATITIPYGENQVVDGNSELVNVTKTITYVVLKNNAVVSAKKDVITVDINDKYDLFSNISCLYNNREKPLTSNKDWANDPTRTYAEVIGDQPDYSVPGEYLIEIRTYPYGLDGEAIDVSYILEVSSGIEITENDNTVLFVGDSMYPREFFSLKEKGEEVIVTDDMIEGKIDFFKAGNYPLTLNYKNESLTIVVSIIDKDIVGNYVSPYQTLVDNSSIEGSTSDEGYDNSGEDEPDIEVARPLKEMIISKDGIKSLDGMSVTDWKAIDSNNFTFNIFSFEYTMHYENGVVICLPVNDTHMSFSDSNRPFVYVNSDLYTIEKKLTIGSSGTHVFNLSNTGYSIDLVYLVNKETKQGFWYGLKTNLIKKNGADCYYSYQYGEFNPSEDFTLQVGNKYQIEFLGETYLFSLSSEEKGQIIKIDSLERKYANMTFNGSIDGKSAVLSFNENQTAKLTIDGKEIFSLIFNEYASLVNGKLDYNENVVKFYDGQKGYSYEFNLDLTNSTFTMTNYDHLFGLFTTSDSEYSSTKFFFDGYGKGVAYGLGNATYQTFPFSYKEENGLVDIDFINVGATFKYKDGVSFRIDSFRNVITIDNIANKNMISLKFVNEKIVDGLYVSFSKNTIPMMDNIEDTKNELLSYVNITSKDGLVPDSEKENYLDLSYVDFDQVGFYPVVVKTEINNQIVTHYYGIHISEPLYRDHELVGVYQSSSDSKYTFEFNEFGNAIVTKNVNGSIVTYEGAVIFSDDGFMFDAKDVNGNVIKASGNIEAHGLVSMLIQGQEVVGGYFYTSNYSSRVTGFGSNVIREFKNQDESIYFYCSNTTSKGKRVTIDIINGLTLDDVGVVFSAKDSDGKEVLYAKLSSWSSDVTGLVLADAYRGDYSNNQSKLSLDGFGFDKTKKGDCKLDNVSYKYYAFNHEIFALVDENNTLVKYVIINTQNKTYSDITSDYSLMNITGTYGVVNFNGITSDYQLVIDKFGVGSFTSGSTSSDDYSESEDYGDIDYTTTSSVTYYGRIISSQENNGKMVFNFVGYTLSDQPKAINITLTKLGDNFVKCSAVSETVQVTKYMVSNYSTSVKYIGNERANYISTIMVNDKPIYLYYETDKSDLKIAQIEELNGIKFGTKGSIFNVRVGSNVVISEGLCTESSYSPFNGYVFANELKGTFKPSTGTGEDLTLDGFAYSMFDISGKATYGSELTYKQFKDNVIELIDGSNTIVIELDIANKTYTIVDSSYNGSLLGTFTKVTPETDNPTLTFDTYSRALYVSSSGTVYNCMITHNTETNEFSLNGTRVNDIYGDSIIGTGKLIGEGVIQFNIDYEGKILSYYFVKEGYKVEVFSAISKTTGIIYQITNESTSKVSFYYAPSDIETLDGEVTILNEKDSATSTFDEVGSIFSLSLRDEIILVARLENKTLNLGYTLANLDERKTYTDENGNTLFTNGFGEGKTNLGTAILNDQTYFYYYNPSLDDTIVLYDANGNIEKYVVYYPDGSFVAQSSVLNSDVFDMNTYRNMLSPDYVNGYIEFDSFGFFNIESYSCAATFNSDFTSFTFTGRNGNLKIAGTGTILERGLFLLEYSGDQNACTYYSTFTNTISGGSNGKNIIFQYENHNKETKYLFAKQASYNKADFIGYVNLELETPDIPLGTIGSIFKVYSLNNELLVRGRWTGTYNGNVNVGFAQSDPYFGAFTNTDLGTITLDGYGKASRGNDAGTYVVTLTNGNYKLDLTLASGNYNYLLDLTNRTYAEPEPDIFKGRSFLCSKIATYLGETVWSSLTFDGAGGVKIIIYCEDDYYYPYCWSTQGKTGITGSYTFEGTNLHLEFPGDRSHAIIEYNFTMDSETNPTVLTAVNCNFETYYPGYVSEGMTFNLQ